MSANILLINESTNLISIFKEYSTQIRPYNKIAIRSLPQTN